MDESALQHRLDAIERRQTLMLWLLAGAYVFAAAWLLVDAVEAVTAWHAGLGVTVLALAVAITGTIRRRAARQ